MWAIYADALFYIVPQVSDFSTQFEEKHSNKVVKERTTKKKKQEQAKTVSLNFSVLQINPEPKTKGICEKRPTSYSKEKQDQGREKEVEP